MTPDWWWGLLVGSLAATFVWGLGLIVIIATLGTRHQPMDGRQYIDGHDL